MSERKSSSNESNLPANKNISPMDVNKLENSGGEPIPQPFKHALEAKFGADFSDVRIHTDPEAAQLARSLEARAFTVSRHIVFATGEYQPYSAGGQKLLAHELTHVVQQRSGRKVSNED